MIEPLIIDSFAGGGGASTGIELALGRSPDYAINHSGPALALHAANHPQTIHLNSNIWDVQPLSVTKGRPVGLLWASPDCKHFSKAKGGAPRDRNIRDLAWVVVKWAEEAKPAVIGMENVEEFLTWGPIDNEGQPVRELAGQTYELWVSRLKRAGYKVQWRELRACDYGAPTIRKRFFLIARRDGQKITWPKPTHGKPGSPAVIKGKLLPWRNAAECIDWSIPCPSIFDTAAQIKEKLNINAKRPLAPNTMARIARGLQRYVLQAQRPFLVNLTHGGRCEDVAEPFRTITGAHRGEKAVVEPYLISIAHGDSGGRREYPLSDPYGVVTAGGITHAVCAPHIMTMRNAAKPFNGADEPAHTITAGGAGLATVAATIMGCGGRAAQSRPRGLDEPTGTITAKADACVTAAFFAKYYGTGDGSATDEPLHTVTVKDRMAHMQAELAAPPFTPAHAARARAVAAFLRAHGAWDEREFVTLEIGGAAFVIVDIGMRMLTPRELFNAQGFPADYQIEGVWEETANGRQWRAFPKDVQVSCCGNSVCPPLAQAIIKANCQHLTQPQTQTEAA